MASDKTITTNNGAEGYSSDHPAPATVLSGAPRSGPTIIRSLAQNLTANIQMHMDMKPDMMTRIYKCVFETLEEAACLKKQ